MKCSLVDGFQWSLRDIDHTDIESLIPFVFHYPAWKAKRSNSKKRERAVYADQVDWL